MSSIEELENSTRIKSPTGADVWIPNNVDTQVDQYTSLKTSQEIQAYYNNNGYVVLRNLISSDLCDQARSIFKSQVKPYSGYLYRQASGNPEKHIFTEYGYMLNSLLNIQDLPTSEFSDFKDLGLQILTHANMHQVLLALFGEPARIIQTMYFEGNPSTWAHQDTYYLDSSDLGKMCAAWIAVEDIQPGAGRFYIYPGSHKIDLSKNGGDFDIAFNHQRYKQLVISIIKKYQLECRAPALNKGDVLFWNAKTIHGSLETTQPQYSRSSFTAHYVPRSTQCLQYQRRLLTRKSKTIGNFEVDYPKDLDEFRNRLIMHLETEYPSQFLFLKRLAIKATLK